MKKTMSVLKDNIEYVIKSIENNIIAFANTADSQCYHRALDKLDTLAVLNLIDDEGDYLLRECLREVDRELAQKQLEEWKKSKRKSFIRPSGKTITYRDVYDYEE